MLTFYANSTLIQQMKWTVLFASLLVACSVESVQFVSEPANEIYWSDGDSGRVDGMKFRLANVDAPETGGVGSVGGAKCEAERVLGFEAKAFMVELTSNAELAITSNSGPDRYGRQVITLSVNGADLAATAMEVGHLKPWPHDGRRALSKKPNWC